MVFVGIKSSVDYFSKISKHEAFASHFHLLCVGVPHREITTFMHGMARAFKRKIKASVY